ncbi:hypothetical protein IL306_008947 [Fusarium sp. DS 682]|nr:hypothetical protein IL306_008947 [Fusarium sp. DS 682]
MDSPESPPFPVPPEARVIMSNPCLADLTDASVFPSFLIPDSFDDVFGDQAHIALLFKICLRKCRDNPFYIFSPIRGLHAETNETIWGHTFTLELCRLMTHSFFEKDGTVDLTMILQFAVICRTDDRRPWNMPELPDVDALKRLRDLMDGCPGPLSTPISEIFETLCANEEPPHGPLVRPYVENFSRAEMDAIENFLIDPKHLVFLMLHLAKVVRDSPKPAGPYITKECHFDVYSVTTLDLQNIRKAIDTMRLHCGEGDYTMVFSTQLAFDRYMTVSKIEDVFPHDADQLYDHLGSSIIRREQEILFALQRRNQE